MLAGVHAVVLCSVDLSEGRKQNLPLALQRDNSGKDHVQCKDLAHIHKHLRGSQVERGGN